MTVLPCHNSICVNISGWNQRQIPNDNFANDFPNRKHREFWQRVRVPSAHNLGINPCYLQRMGLSAHGKYSGQQGLSGPPSLQLIHRSPAQWSDLHRVILTHWSLPFLRWKAELTMAALTSWELLQACRNSGYGGRVHLLFYYCDCGTNNDGEQSLDKISLCPCPECVSICALEQRPQIGA